MKVRGLEADPLGSKPVFNSLFSVLSNAGRAGLTTAALVRAAIATHIEGTLAVPGRLEALQQRHGNATEYLAGVRASRASATRLV